MHDELLNESLFIDLDQARQAISAWITDYNTASRIPRSDIKRRRLMTLTAPKGLTSAAALTAAE